MTEKKKSKNLLSESLFPKPKLMSIVCWIAVLFFFLCLCNSFFGIFYSKPEDFKAFAQFTQFIFCLIVLANTFRINVTTQPPDPFNSEKDEYEKLKKAIPAFANENNLVLASRWGDALTNINELKKLILFVWGTWAFYFLSSYIRTEIFNHSSTVCDSYPFLCNYNLWEPIDIFFNNLTFIGLLLCYKKLNNPKIDFYNKYTRSYGMTVLILAIIQGVWISHSDYPYEINASLKLLSGILNAIVIASFAGRLESRYISPPPIYIWALYIYAALQPLILLTSLSQIDFVTLAKDKFTLNSNEVMIAANVRIWLLLIGKAFFYLFILWLLDSKRLINYFLIFPELKKEVDLFDQYKDAL